MSGSLKKIAGDSFYLYLTQGLNYILPFLILPFLIKTLSTASFGIFVYSQAVAQIMLLIVDFGFNISATKEVSLHAGNKKKITEIYWAVNGIKLLFATVVFSIVVSFFYVYEPLYIYRTGVFAAGFTVFGSLLFPIWLFQGLGKVRLMAVISSVAKILFLPLIFLYVRNEDDYMPAIVLHTLVQIGAGVLATVYVLTNIKLSGLKRNIFVKNTIGYYIKESWPIFLSNSSISLYTSGITFILGFFVDAKGVGIYGAIDRIVRVICFGIYGPISQAAFPVLVRAKMESVLKASRMLKTIFFVMLVLMCSIVMGFLIVKNFVLENFFPELISYETLLVVSIFSIIPIALGGVCGQLGLIALGGNSERTLFSRVYIIVGLCSLAVSFFAISSWEINGAVYSVVASEIFVFLLMFYLVIKRKLLW